MNDSLFAKLYKTLEEFPVIFELFPVTNEGFCFVWKISCYNSKILLEKILFEKGDFYKSRILFQKEDFLLQLKGVD